MWWHWSAPPVSFPHGGRFCEVLDCENGMSCALSNMKIGPCCHLQPHRCMLLPLHSSGSHHLLSGNSLFRWRDRKQCQARQLWMDISSVLTKTALVPQDVSVLVKPGYIPPRVLSLHFKDLIEGEEQEKCKGFPSLQSVLILENGLSGPSHKNMVLLALIF